MSVLRPEVRVLAEGLGFPEGPAFDSKNRLWFVELHAGNLCCLEGDQLTRTPTGGSPNGLAIGRGDTVWFCDSMQNAIRIYDPVQGTFQTACDRADGLPLDKPNDLVWDSQGNLIFTCPGESRWEPDGYVCCWSGSGEARRILGGLYFPNGLAFSPDGRELVLAETRRQRLWRGPWATESWKPAPWASVGGNIGPDGLAFASDGTLYVAVFSSANIKSVRQDGEVADVLEIPGQNPTNCAFDPAGHLGLVVTEAERGRLLSIPSAGRGAPLFLNNPPI
jgi:gluconolactonase